MAVIFNYAFRTLIRFMTRYILLIFALAFIISACSERKTPEEKRADPLEEVKKDSIIKKHNEIKIDTFPKINYSELIVENNKMLDSIRKTFKYDSTNPAKNRAFLTLNRKERRFIRVGDTLLIPDKFDEDMRAYSVFPAYYPGASALPKIIMVSNVYQCYACYENGKLVRFAAANTGKEKTQTYPGRYSLVWRQLVRHSSLDSSWIMPYTWNFHQYAGNAFHEFDMPGYAASHSCIRQFETDARWLYYWGKRADLDSNKHFIWGTGTPVIIIDHFDFTHSKVKLWRHLSSNKDVTLSLPEKPMEVEEALIPISQIPEELRGMLPKRQRYVHAEDTLRARGIIRDSVKITVSVNYNKLKRQKAKAKRKADSLRKLKAEIEEQSRKDSTNKHEAD